MKRIIKPVFLVFLFTCYSCVSTSYLPTDDSVTYAPTGSIKVYWEEPQEPYVIIGRVSAKSEDVKEEKIFKGIKKKAMAVGAHAIIMGGTSQESSVVGIPSNFGGTIIAPVSSTRLAAFAIRFVD